MWSTIKWTPKVVKKIVNRRIDYLLSGYVGYLPSDKSINVVFRGSSSIQNWITDLSTTKTAYNGYCCGKSCQVHKGFYKEGKEGNHALITNLQWYACICLSSRGVFGHPASSEESLEQVPKLQGEVHRSLSRCRTSSTHCNEPEGQRHFSSHPLQFRSATSGGCELCILRILICAHYARHPSQGHCASHSLWIMGLCARMQRGIWVYQHFDKSSGS